MPWGPAEFATIADLQSWLNEQHVKGGWHETTVQIAADVWEVITDGVLARWKEGSHGAAAAKEQLSHTVPTAITVRPQLLNAVTVGQPYIQEGELVQDYVAVWSGASCTTQQLTTYPCNLIGLTNIERYFEGCTLPISPAYDK